jgi:hypothetical protein
VNWPVCLSAATAILPADADRQSKHKGVDGFDVVGDRSPGHAAAVRAAEHIPAEQSGEDEHRCGG